jgi:hypothetical protein
MGPPDHPATTPAGEVAAPDGELDGWSRPTRGRHARNRRTRRVQAGIRVAVGLLVLVLLAGLVQTVRLIRADGGPSRPAAQAAPGPAEVPTTGLTQRPPPGSGTSSNLVLNWSFEKDLSGWQVLGPAKATHEVGGRTSGSSARIAATGSGPIGLRAPGLVVGAPTGRRYVATIWISSSTPGTRVAARLISIAGGKQTVKVVVGVIQPGSRWSMIRVAHTVPAANATVSFEVTTPGRSLVIDEVTVREG